MLALSVSSTETTSDMIGMRRVKRLEDLVLSTALLVAVLPVGLVAVSAMGLNMLVCRLDRGRLLYRERRVSSGREFDLLKFRTVREDALARMEPGGHARLLESDTANLTWAGRRVLKPWYLDELPQLLNVLRGEMSLVGPRPWPIPLVRRQVERGVDYRNRVPAGLTGPAQISKGTEAAFEQLDVEYAGLLAAGSGWSVVRRDLAVLRQTVQTMLRGEGLRF
jgi:lipopolysaccharide/colanic/teichoic acid biosynthesis glycosyltransferase